jgi:hypothetical protein
MALKTLLHNFFFFIHATGVVGPVLEHPCGASIIIIWQFLSKIIFEKNCLK